MDEMQHIQVSAAVQPSGARSTGRRRGLLIGLGVLGLVGAVGTGSLLVLAPTDAPAGESDRVAARPRLSSSTTILTLAKRRCAPDYPFVKLGDNGRSLMIQTGGLPVTTESVAGTLKCLMYELGVSDALKMEIDTTRALDGRQTADWDNLHASWTYHPSSGLNMVVTMPPSVPGRGADG